MGAGHRNDDEELPLTERVRQNWKGFHTFVWNSEEGTVLGRGGKSWAKISLFYFVFYSCLAGFWAALLAIFLQTISYSNPKFTSLISTPALHSIPTGNDDYRITWEPDNPDTYKRIIEEMQAVYNGLKQTSDDQVDCTTLGINTGGQRLCSFDVSLLGPCQAPNFGWDSLNPCLFIRLNRVSGWSPVNYENAEDVPERIRAVYMDDNVAINCFPRRDSDRRNFNSSRPFPVGGIPFGFFPYRAGKSDEDRQRTQIQPVVAVQISLIRPNEVTSFECQAYTGNILPRGGLFDADDESRFRIYLNAKRNDK